jgi:hypothetical protein
MHRRSILFASVFLIAGSAQAGAAGLSVPLDEARVVTFTKPVATVFLADPAVADLNTIDATHVYVLGKAFGQTNLIGLDAQGNQIVSEHVTVLGSSHLVTLNKGSSQYTFACASARCEAATVPGDEHNWHDATMSEMERRMDDGIKQASAGTPH